MLNVRFGLSVVIHDFNFSPQETVASRFCESETSLVFLTSSRPARSEILLYIHKVQFGSF